MDELKTIKALSVRQPYAQLIADKIKSIELRNWPTNYRGPLLICSSKKPAFKIEPHLSLGVSICFVTLTDVVDYHHSHESAAGYPSARYSYSWILDRQITVPSVPIKGQLRIFDVHRRSETEPLFSAMNNYLST